MKIRREDIPRLGSFIVDYLLKRGEIMLKAPPDEVKKAVLGEIERDMEREEELDREVEEFLEVHLKRTPGNVNRRKLFLMVKKKLAKERGIIL